MADQAITALPKKTYSGSSQIASADYILGIDSAEGYQMLIQDLGEYIINRATASLAGSTQTLASAISALNSNQTIKRGDTITFGGTNSMYAGRIGWNGLQIWFSVPMDKPAQESIYFTPSEIGGGNIYCCTANAAQALDRNLISKIEMRMANGSPYISVCLTLSSNPFSVSDAVMNVMFSGSQSITIP